MQLTNFLIDNVEKASGVRLSLQLYTQLVAKPQPPVLTGGTTAAAKNSEVHVTGMSHGMNLKIGPVILRCVSPPILIDEEEKTSRIE